jgi:hypothetical protein
MKYDGIVFVYMSKNSLIRMLNKIVISTFTTIRKMTVTDILKIIYSVRIWLQNAVTS